MFRSVCRISPRIASSAYRAIMGRPVVAKTLAQRFYSANVSKDQVSQRVVDVIKAFDKNSPNIANKQISSDTQFHKDLGLDSLDTVELLVAIEEEFDIEIPDKVADDLRSVGETVDYIASNPDAN
ncbi:hypothetical protein SKDZ_11G0260 [Saccharomyces kudriavzevii ZP591]|uniref:Uncharacterized protein n=3 Tax=Saccharomyces TaxID=4930 RepID=A0AA35J2W0_SACK1|nr:uncharacterized protein SKDI_11G0290 [Saccharomyces kudriavzevii IFO 1802]EJT42645.1 ACP1-like protein [Saccharomyces kudriavzevii IFO 1802]CAI4044379.1 hypothetical protein SKDI_11G0290 [Saccharomyces kudriavzevii IFO 1802]CAI4044382.1 hypothetical protein SKDZ_11G0260 [Saccharomyces kudriavzevii ZP591]